MYLAHYKKRFLFEIHPYFQQFGRVCLLETELWGKFYEMLDKVGKKI